VNFIEIYNVCNLFGYMIASEVQYFSFTWSISFFGVFITDF